MNKHPKQAVLSLSGGLDSSTLLLHLLANGYEVCALSFDYGQKHRVELERAKELVDYINQNLIKVSFKDETKLKDDLLSLHGIDSNEFNAMINEVKQTNRRVNYQVIKLDGLSQLLNSALVTGGAEVPEGHYAEENMKATVVPNRNKIFSSIIQAVALSIAESKNCNVEIAMGIHAGDHAIYPDCRQEFRDIDYDAFKAGNWGAEKVAYYTPYLLNNKFEILKDGEKCCDKLGLNFDEVYKCTNTSYKPMQHDVFYENEHGETLRSTEWFSDYKSASSVERVEAFLKLDRKDPVQYADEYGPVAWEYVVEYVKQILDAHENK
jgi:7-cyano-7-deazaguanine synthase